MKFNLTFVFSTILSATLFISCGGGSSSSAAAPGVSKDVSSYDPTRGEGKFKNVEVKDQLDMKLVEGGKKVYDVKCSACHKLTEEKLVGPGWKGITHRKKAEWIMNFATNTDEMLDKDPEAQAQLEICLVRMPNQNLSDDEVREVYEFMRQNDGVK
jgi:cytochrome c5